MIKLCKRCHNLMGIAFLSICSECFARDILTATTEYVKAL
jgi:hypothetical protein